MLFVFHLLNLVNPVKKFRDRLSVAAGTMIKARDTGSETGQVFAAGPIRVRFVGWVERSETQQSTP
jgi:hypothetical protein